MEEYKQKLLEYISKNYDNVVISAKSGEYIVIDLIPGGDDNKLYNISELMSSCFELKIDTYMFTRSGYPENIGDGIRMGRYWYYMRNTTKEILEDLKNFKSV